MSPSVNICKKLTDLCQQRQPRDLISILRQPAEDLSYLQPLPPSGSECRQAPARCSLPGGAPKLTRSSRGEPCSLGTLHFRAIPCSHLSLLKSYIVPYRCLVAYFLRYQAFWGQKCKKDILKCYSGKLLALRLKKWRSGKRSSWFSFKND